MLREKIKWLIKQFLPYYELYRIYQIQLNNCKLQLTTKHQIVNLTSAEYSQHPLYKETALYSGKNSYGYGLIFEDQLVAVQWYWFSQPCEKLGWWPLPHNSIMSMHIQVLQEHQGKGLSEELKGFSLSDLSTKGFDYVYSRVWHNHWASIAMNNKLGSKQVGWLFYISLFKKKIQLRW
jgi:hypothetical protein